MQENKYLNANTGDKFYCVTSAGKKCQQTVNIDCFKGQNCLG